MSDRRTYLVAGVAVLALAIAARALPLYWSPLPATLDGIYHATNARDALAAGHLPLAGMPADNLGFAALLTAASAVLGSSPFVVAQPLVAICGGASCLVGVALVRRLGHDSGLSPRAVRVAAVAAGLLLALEGLYLRRTGVPDEEAFAFLLLPLLAYAVDRVLVGHRRAWYGVAIPLLVLLPLQHALSALLAALALTGVFAIRLVESPTRRRGLLGLGLVGGFWTAVVAYYELAGRTLLVVPYVDRVTGHAGLFLAWVVVLVGGVVWFRGASARGKRGVILAPIGLAFVLLAANAVVPVFPGTIATPPLLLALVVALLVPVGFAGWTLPALGGRGSAAVVLLALLVAPLVHLYFSLSAALTPAFFGTVLRTQTFAHLPVLALAGLAVGFLVDRRPASVPSGRLRSAAVVVLAAAILLTTPIAYVDLDTLAYPSTTTESEFQAASFAAEHAEGAWTSDAVLTTIARHLDRSDTGSVSATASWLRGGPPPDCPVLSLEKWATTGAYFYPAPPETIDSDHLTAWRTHGNLVYAVGGYDPGALVVPRSAAGQSC